MPCLYQHGVFSPVACRPAWRVVGTPCVHSVSPFPCEIGHLGVAFFQSQFLVGIGGMGEEYGEQLVSLCEVIACGVAIRVRVFLFHRVLGFLREVSGIVCFIQYRLPQPYTRVVSVPAHHLADVVIDSLGEYGVVVPELPSRNVVNDEKSQLVASIHKGGILWAVGVADDFQTGIPEFLRIFPMEAVGDSVSDNSEILMAVCTNQRLSIRFSVEPETLCSLEFDAANAYALAIAVNDVPFLVENSYEKMIQIRVFRRP